ncbi:MAG TPA: class I SAM-dependent methyltransferase [Chloroflexota bacterium]|nr:class I SAM-dependent methyltransferase [Chloroflexota bacterium]
MSAASIDQGKLQQLLGQAVNDLGALLSGTLVVVGDKLGLYRALKDLGPLTSAALAEATGTAERYVREWLASQAASGYISYVGEGRYALSAEQAELLANEDSPFCLLGGFQVTSAATRALPKLLERFKTGDGLGWHEHDVDLFEGTERFFRPGYMANLVSSWLPSLDGILPKLERGIDVADVGCGRGASTIIMAQAFPNSRFVGSDYHAPSIEMARQAAAAAGITNCRFEVASAKEYQGMFDLVCHFDCLHDMGDPVGAARHVLKSLRPDGAWMIVEPFANDDVADNLNPVGRVYYSASTFICTPASLSQEVGLALGAQAGEARLRAVVTEAGFSRVRRAAETAFNIILDARP